MAGTFDMQPKGLMKVMLPLMTGAVRKDFPQQMAQLQAILRTAAHRLTVRPATGWFGRHDLGVVRGSTRA